MSLWVVATGTEVGKTVISALLMARYGADGRVAYWKPVASGARDERDSETVAELCPNAKILPESYLFDEPLSPHLAARLEGRSVEPNRLVADHAAYRISLSDAASTAVSLANTGMVIEGVGGVLVPLRDGGPLLIDLLADIPAPCLVVAHSILGTINHTLLTLEALRHRHLPLAGVVLNGPPNAENRKAIETFGDIEVIDEVDWLQPLDAETVGKAAQNFDRAARLAPLLGIR